MDPRQQDQYFAGMEAEKTASILLRRAQSFYTVMTSNAYIDKLRKMWRAYYGAYANDVGNGHQVSFTGEQGELTILPVNHFRNLASHMLVMVTSSRPTMEARAINTDYKSLAQTYLANGILDYYMREKRLEECLKKAVEMAIILGAGFIKMDWNATAGEAVDVDPDTNEFSYEGEIEFTNLSPLDVVVDGTKEEWDNEWIMVRSFKNRHNLAAKYPEHADKIKSLPAKVESSIFRLALFTNDETDDIPVYEFYHKRTEAMPDGRYMLFLADDIVLLDTKMPYRHLPVFRISAGDILGTPYGYSPMFDVFPIQEGINSLYSTIMTNNNTFGVQNVFVPEGSNINVNSLEGGMNIITGTAKPEPLNLTETPAETYKFLEMLIQSAETISGVNSVARGNPEASLKSGTALALVQSMALQFVSGLQNSYVKLIEDVGTGLINNLKDFATAPKMVALVGKNNRPYLKEFVGEDLNAISRVIVDLGNPLSRTIAGRVQMAEQMLQMKLIQSPEQYFQVINTGRIESLYEGEMNELLLIKSENEQLLEGQNPIVSPLDQHRLHINEHKAVLADPDLRKDANLVKNTLDHIEAHVNALRNTDPGLLAIINEQPLPPVGGSQPNPQGMQSQQPPQGSMGGPIPEMMMQPGGMPQSGDMMMGPSANASLPNLPHPAPPFENVPVMASQVIPQ